MGAGESRLSDRQVERLRATTIFSAEEIREWHATFKKECPTGLMTKPEFIKMYGKMFPDGDARDFADIIFRAYDVDGSGTIDFKEYLCTLSLSSKGDVDSKLRWAFRLYDLDGNGYVTKDEALKIFLAINKMRGLTVRKRIVKDLPTPTTAVNAIFLHLDRDNDNRLSESEFITGAKASPAILKVLTSQ